MDLTTKPEPAFLIGLYYKDMILQLFSLNAMHGECRAGGKASVRMLSWYNVP